MRRKTVTQEKLKHRDRVSNSHCQHQGKTHPQETNKNDSNHTTTRKGSGTRNPGRDKHDIPTRDLRRLTVCSCFQKELNTIKVGDGTPVHGRTCRQPEVAVSQATVAPEVSEQKGADEKVRFLQQVGGGTKLLGSSVTCATGKCS